MKRVSMFLFSALMALLISGCVTSEPAPEGKLHIRTLVDGSDTLFIKGNSMWYVHHAFQLPGKWAGSDLPTYINQEQAWYPVWSRNLSDVVKIEDPDAALPEVGKWDSSNMSVKIYTSGFGVHKVREYPNAENDYTLIVDMDDSEPLGGHWYAIDIDWDETAASAAAPVATQE